MTYLLPFCIAQKLASLARSATSMNLVESLSLSSISLDPYSTTFATPDLWKCFRSASLTRAAMKEAYLSVWSSDLVISMSKSALTLNSLRKSSSSA